MKNDNLLNEYETIYKKLSGKFVTLCNKSILLTGATGMIGSYMVDFLQYVNKTHNANMHITLISRNKDNLVQRFGGESDSLRFIEQDLAQPFTSTQHFDYIVHVGGCNSPSEFANNPVGTMKTTLIGTMSLLDIAQRDKAHFTLISSGEIYGHKSGKVFSENDYGSIDTKNPRSCYPESRRAAETLCASYAKQYGLSFNVARLGYVYGPTITDKSDLAVAQFLRAAVAGQNIVLKSSGKQLRTWLYVGDAVSAILYAILCGKPGEFYNVAGSTAQLKEFAETLAKIAGISVVYETAGDSKIVDSVLSADKLKALGWQPMFTMQEAMRRTYTIKKNQVIK